MFFKCHVGCWDVCRYVATQNLEDLDRYLCIHEIEDRRIVECCMSWLTLTYKKKGSHLYIINCFIDFTCGQVDCSVLSFASNRCQYRFRVNTISLTFAFKDADACSGGTGLCCNVINIRPICGFCITTLKKELAPSHLRMHVDLQDWAIMSVPQGRHDESAYDDLDASFRWRHDVHDHEFLPTWIQTQSRQMNIM